MTQSFGAPEEQNKTATNIVESLKTDGDKLNNGVIVDKSTARRNATAQAQNNIVVPFEREADNSAKMSDTEPNPTDEFEDQLSSLFLRMVCTQHNSEVKVDDQIRSLKSRMDHETQAELLP